MATQHEIAELTRAQNEAKLAMNAAITDVLAVAYAMASFGRSGTLHAKLLTAVKAHADATKARLDAGSALLSALDGHFHRVVA